VSADLSARAEWANEDGYEPRHRFTTDDVQTLELLSRDTSRRFHDLMDSAMLVSGMKYGAVAAAYPQKVNAIESLQKRLKQYALTGNVEFLVDAANFAMIEFMHPSHPEAHYRATDARESPGRVMQNRGEYGDYPNQLSNERILAPGNDA
jgi:predicted MPP superfamily phosphohydrolase